MSTRILNKFLELLGFWHNYRGVILLEEYEFTGMKRKVCIISVLRCKMNNYMPITRSRLIDNTRTGFDLYIKSYVNGMPRYVLFSRGYETFSNKTKNELVMRNIGKLYTLVRNFNSYSKYQGNNPKETIVDKRRNTEERSNEVLRDAKGVAHDLLCHTRSGINLGGIKNWVDNAVKFILRDKNALLSMLEETSYELLYIHPLGELSSTWYAFWQTYCLRFV